METMALKTEVKQRWKCPVCGRQFERHNQAHSCKAYPLERHFEKKEYGKKLYERLCEKMEQKTGNFKIESLECCIHLVSSYTFAAVKIFKDKLLVEFTLSSPTKNKRFTRSLKLSEHRFLYYVEVSKEKEINAELINWLKKAHDKR